MADGPARLLGQLAGDRDDADDLLGAEGGRHSGARDVVEDLLEEGRQLLVTEQTALRLLEFGGGLQPAIAPLANGEPGQTQEFGGRIDARVGGKSEEDGDAADQTLAGGLAGAKALQQGLHARGRDDGNGRRSTHDPPRS